MSFFKRRKNKEGVADKAPQSLELPNEKHVLDFVQKSTLDIYDKFLHKDVTSVYFKDFEDMPLFEKVNIAEGIVAEKVHVDEHAIRLLCWMEKDSLLLGHVHPNFSEHFRIIYGELRDRFNDRTVWQKGDLGIQPKGIPHEPYCNEKTFMVIDAIKENV